MKPLFSDSILVFNRYYTLDESKSVTIELYESTVYMGQRGCLELLELCFLDLEGLIQKPQEHIALLLLEVRLVRLFQIDQKRCLQKH